MYMLAVVNCEALSSNPDIAKEKKTTMQAPEPVASEPGLPLTDLGTYTGHLIF
jgi:hypothetical protein